MKKIYYVVNNGGEFLLTDDGEFRRILSNEYAYCPRNEEGQRINVDKFIANVEDDSSWDVYSGSVDKLTDGATILAVADANC